MKALARVDRQFPQLRAAGRFCGRPIATMVAKTAKSASGISPHKTQRACPSPLLTRLRAWPDGAEIRQEIRSRLDVAAGQGCRGLIVDAKELYRALYKGPVFNHSMVFCCNAMRAETTEADNIVFRLRE